VAQPRIGLLAAGFSRLDQTVKLSAGHRAFGRTTEQPVLAPDHEVPDRTLCRVVVNWQKNGFGLTDSLVLIAGQITDGFAQRVLRRHLRLRFLQPGM
jgi:hypothetical protein